MLSFLSVAIMDCVSTVKCVLCVCEACMGVCLHNELELGLFLVSLCLKSRLSLSGHSFFPGFHPIVFKEKGLAAHPQLSWVTPQCADSRGAPKGWVRMGGGLMTVFYSLVEWICELVWLAHSAGWVAWVRAGHQIQTKTSTTTKTVSVDLLFVCIFFLSRFSFYSPHTNSIKWTAPSLSSNPVFVRHILPKTSSTVLCQSDVLATISRVKLGNI